MRWLPFALRSPVAILVGVAALLALIAGFAATRGKQAPPERPCLERTFEGDVFVVCSFDTRRHELRLVTEGADGENLRSLRALRTALGADAERVRFGMNAGMYDDDGDAIGLHVEDGERLHAVSTTDGPGNFHLKPNGVFSLDPTGVAHVETTQAYLARDPAPRWATQSGPMLVIDGELHPAIQHDGASRFVRNGVGVRDGRHVYFVISQSTVSFGKLARFFRDELACPDALFLDGTVSSLWAPSLGRIDGGARLGPMVVVLER